MSDKQHAKRKVFISYSWSSEEHKTWVRELAERLVAEYGVDVVLDQWDLREGQDLNSFMERMVADRTVDKVLVICDDTYVEKANVRKGGVGTESQIISQEVYQRVDQNKFIPIFLALKDNKPHVPTFFRSRMCIDFSTIEKQYENLEQLLRAIYDQPLHQKPQLGPPPEHIFAKDPYHPSTRHRLIQIKNTSDSNQTTALIRDYLTALDNNLETFRMASDPSVELDDAIVENIKSSIGFRDEFVDLVSFAITHRNSPEIYEEFFEFFQNITKYHFPPKDLKGFYTHQFDNYKFITYELFLYFIATLIKAKRHKEVGEFLQREFFIRDPYHAPTFQPYEYLRPYLNSLEEVRKRRLSLRRVSIMADLIQERANRSDIRLDEIIETDLLLYLRSVLHRCGALWYPVLIIYKSPGDSQTDLFLKAQSKRYFGQLKQMLGVEETESGSSLLEKYLTNRGYESLRVNDESWPIDIIRFFNFENLGTRS